MSRASISESSIRNWFSEVEKELILKLLLNIEASRVFNGDESAFMLAPKSQKVFVKKGEKCVYNIIQNDDKFSNTTEAEFVANIIFTMLMFAKWETTSTTISLGVLTPYNNQRTLVLNKINEKRYALWNVDRPSFAEDKYHRECTAPELWRWRSL